MSSAILIGLTASSVNGEFDRDMRLASFHAFADFDGELSERVFRVAFELEPSARWWAAAVDSEMDLDRVYRIADEIAAGTWDRVRAHLHPIAGLARFSVLLVDLGDGRVEARACDTVDELLRSVARLTTHGAPLGCVHWWCGPRPRSEGE